MFSSSLPSVTSPVSIPWEVFLVFFHYEKEYQAIHASQHKRENQSAPSTPQQGDNNDHKKNAQEPKSQSANNTPDKLLINNHDIVPPNTPESKDKVSHVSLYPRAKRQLNFGQPENSKPKNSKEDQQEQSAIQINKPTQPKKRATQHKKLIFTKKAALKQITLLREKGFEFVGKLADTDHFKKEEKQRDYNKAYKYPRSRFLFINQNDGKYYELKPMDLISKDPKPTLVPDTDLKGFKGINLNDQTPDSGYIYLLIEEDKKEDKNTDTKRLVFRLANTTLPGHDYIAGGFNADENQKYILASGEIYFYKGKLMLINMKSGHFYKLFSSPKYKKAIEELKQLFGEEVDNALSLEIDVKKINEELRKRIEEREKQISSSTDYFFTTPVVPQEVKEEANNTHQNEEAMSPTPSC